MIHKIVIQTSRGLVSPSLTTPVLRDEYVQQTLVAMPSPAGLPAVTVAMVFIVHTLGVQSKHGRRRPRSPQTGEEEVDLVGRGRALNQSGCDQTRVSAAPHKVY